MTNQVNKEFEKWFSTLKVECRGNEPMVVLMTSWSTNAFHAGYQAATKASESEINSLKKGEAELEAAFNAALEEKAQARHDEAVAYKHYHELKADKDKLREALKQADEFITNGIEFGVIRMPDDDLKGIDSAHDTPEIVRKALSSTPAQ